MVFVFGGAKTYEMRPNADVKVTPAIFKSDAFAGLPSELEKYVGYVNATLVLGGQSYHVNHVKKSDLGYKSWQVEIFGKSGEDIDRVVNAVMSIIDRSKEPKPEPVSDDKVKITVALHPQTDLRKILEAMNQYAGKTNGTVLVSGYGFNELPRKLAGRLEEAGLPLQEVKSK